MGSSTKRDPPTTTQSGKPLQRVLLGWELGGGLGHVTRLAALARRLLDCGAQTLVALRPETESWPILSAVEGYGPRIRLISAPAVDPQGSGVLRIEERHTLADSMTGFGYDRPELIFAAADLWNSIIVRYRPDVIVSDSAPSLNLVAAGRIPLVCVGSPFLTPPQGHPLPHLRLDIEEVSVRARRGEQRVLDAINTIRRANQLPLYAHCADVWHGDKTFVAAPPCLDPFAWDESRRHVEPFNLDIGGALPAVPADVYCYVPGLGQVGAQLDEAFSRLEWSCTAYLGKRSNLWPPRGRLTILPRPVKLLKQLQATRLYVHQGGLASTWAALRTGTPQLILPPGIEMINNAALAAKLSQSVTVQDPRAIPGTSAMAALLEASVRESPPLACNAVASRTCSVTELIDEALALCESSTTPTCSPMQ